MSNRKQHLRGMAISFFVIAISFFNFMRLAGSECIRAIHVVTLLVCGIAIGVFISNLFVMLRNK
jgi:high-affinity K+ transport system ATPase subunit B